MNEADVREMIAPLLPPVTGLIATARQFPTLELEARLVVQGDQRIPHIPKPEFQTIFTFFMENQKRFDKVIPWRISTAYYFQNPYLRYVISEGKEGKVHEWLLKTPLQQFNYNVQNRPFGVRISLKDEKPTTPVKDPMVYVRIRKRATLILGHFCFDFTIVWAGKSLEAAKASKITYEIEVEFVPNTGAASEVEPKNNVLAQHFLFRILELQGLETPTKVVSVS